MSKYIDAYMRLICIYDYLEEKMCGIKKETMSPENKQSTIEFLLWNIFSYSEEIFLVYVAEKSYLREA